MATEDSASAEELFSKLDELLRDNIDGIYFSEPREFRPLIEVLTVLNEKAEEMANTTKSDQNKLSFAFLRDRNQAYNRLLKQQDVVKDVINQVVQFRHGGLNNAVDTMSDVLKEYHKGRDDIRNLVKSLHETQSVLTARKTGQIPLKELWLKKVEVEHRLRMVRELERIKNTSHIVNRLMQQKRYLTAVLNLNRAITNMFDEDLVTVVGLNDIRENLMNLKETLLETCVEELKEIIIGSVSDFELKDTFSDTDSESGENISDNRSDSARSYLKSHADEKSVVAGSIAEIHRSTSSHIPSAPASKLGSTSGIGIAAYSFHSQTSPALGSSSSTNGFRAGAGDAWSYELKDLDESIEASLVDPTSSGSLFTRLLVKTVGVLCCEGDVERMLLETVAKSFKMNTIKKLREFAATRLERATSNEEAKGSSDPFALHSRLFSEYIGSLLDSSLSTFSRLMYILKLLNISRTSDTNPNIQRGGDVNNKGNNSRFVLALWDSIEEMIIGEIKAHLIEPDVEDITDRARRGSLQRSQSLSPGFAASSNDENDQVGEDGFQYERSKLIFRPTARHGAAVYKRVLLYSQSVERIMKENDLFDFAVRQRVGGDNSSGLNTAALLSKAANAKTTASLTVMETMALQAIQSGHGKTASATNKILAMIEHFLEDELIPVIQSTVNNVMRDVQLNSSYFTVPLEQLKAAGSQSVGRDGAGATVCPAAQMCMTAVQPLFAYWLQLNQKQHRVMLSTVLERTIRGFVATAREEVETLSYHMISASTAHQGPRGNSKFDIKNTVIEGLKCDPMFQSYRQSVYAGKSTVDDLIVGSSGSLRDSGGDGVRRNSKTMSARASLDDTNSSIYNNALEISAWASFWDLSNAQYPITDSYCEKVLSDMNTVSTFASIITGCDWFARRVCSLCNVNTRKVTSNIGSSGSGNPSSSRDSLKFKASRQEISESRSALITAILNGSRELSRLAEEAVALIRGEAQVACFFYLQKLCHLKFQSRSKLSLSSNLDGQSRGPSTMQRKPNKAVADSLRRQEESVPAANEEEAIINSLMHHLQRVVECLGCSQVAAAVISPLTSLVPKILQKCVYHIFAVSGSLSSSSSSSVDLSSSKGDSVALENQYLKTRVLRIVVSVQQSIAALIQDCGHITVEAKRRLIDILTDEFEKLRRFVTLFNMPAAELETFLYNNFNEYSKDEIKLLWARASSRPNDAILSSHTFDDLWKELETRKRSFSSHRAY